MTELVVPADTLPTAERPTAPEVPTPEHGRPPENGRARENPPRVVPEREPGYLRRVFRATERENYHAFLETLPAGRGGALLDLGTHTGDFTLRVAERVDASDVHGVEFIPEHAARARERGIDVVEVDLDEGLPYADGAFDVVTANQVIEHVRRTDVFLSEIRRVLAPDGLACISTNNLSSWHNVVSLALGHQPPPMHVSDDVIVGNPLNPENGWRHPDRGRTHLRLFTVRALTELAAHHGLERVALRMDGFYPLPARLSRVAAAVDRRHAAFMIALFRRA